MTFYHWFWLVAIIIGLHYAGLILCLLVGWERIKPFQAQQKNHHSIVSIIVPFHNEIETLKQCVEGLLTQQIQTTLVEIILVDDHSDDGCTELAIRYISDSPKVCYLQSNARGKKAALELGISKAQGDLIVTTDADCFYPPNWLATVVDYYETHQPNLIIGPIQLKTGGSLFQKFQALEYLSLMASTAGAAGISHPIMCNGANLAFKKDVYHHLTDPFKRDFISGDDVFLLHGFKKLDAKKVHYLKSSDAVVLTPGVNSIKAFLRQRFRWTSKAPGYRDADTIFTAIIVFGISVLLATEMTLSPFIHSLFKPLCFIYGIKTMVDFWFLYRVSPFFGKKNLLWLIPLFEVFYAWYVLVSGLSLLFPGNSRTKG